jgi:hypothetical protein
MGEIQFLSFINSAKAKKRSMMPLFEFTYLGFVALRSPMMPKARQ